MAKHARIRTDEQQERLEMNRALMRSVLSGERRGSSSSTQTSGMSIVLERFVVDRATWQPVPFEGDDGVERLLDELAKTYADERVMSDEHLVGMSGSIAVDEQNEPIKLQISLGAGAQLVLALGPSEDACALRDALSSFDRQFHIVYSAMDRDYELIAQGYHPAVEDPADIELVPTTEHALTDAYLVRRRGRGNELSRCTAATRLRIPVSSAEETLSLYQMLVALSPVLTFLTDNTVHVRGSEPILTPLMARTLLMERSVANRIGIPDDMLGPEANLDDYVQWLEGIRPIFFTDEEGSTFPTGADTIEHLMCERDLTPGEAGRLASAAWSVVRLLEGQIELSCADSLPPRLAGAYLALVKGLIASERTRGAVAHLIDLPALDEPAVQAAWDALRDDGWTARVYGRTVSQLANDLAVVASGGLDKLEERRMLVALTQLWEVECVPRDLALPSPDFDLIGSPEEPLVDLYGTGSLSAFDKLDEELPVGSTEVFRFRHLF